MKKESMKEGHEGKKKESMSKKDHMGKHDGKKKEVAFGKKEKM